MCYVMCYVIAIVIIGQAFNALKHSFFLRFLPVAHDYQTPFSADPALHTTRKADNRPPPFPIY